MRHKLSQPTDYAPGQDPFLVPIKSIEDLIGLFHNAQKPRKDQLIGVELEMFGQINLGTTPLPYEGDISITSLFKHLAQTKAYGFKAIYEKDNIVAVSSDLGVIALEPGGQIEVAAKPYHIVLDAIKALEKLVKEIKSAANNMGIDVFTLGIHPLAKQNDMAFVKKERYKIMRSYMSNLLGRGLDMMTRSCSIQLNIDYANEQDMVKKTRLAAALSPIYALLCSSSAFMDGSTVKHSLERSYIWRNTDPDRTGIPAIIFDKNFGYDMWVNYVLDVPMYFIRRDDKYLNLSGQSFRDFMNCGYAGHQASIRDFYDHMTTVFTEVRLKPFLELRSPDSLPLNFVNALLSLTDTLFYNHNAFSKVSELFADLTHKELDKLFTDLISKGKEAQFRNSNVFDIAGKILDIAVNNTQENSLLKPFISLVENNTTCAEVIKSQFNHIDKSNIHSLVRKFDPLCKIDL